MKRTAVALAFLLLATPAGAANIADAQKTYDAGDFAAALSQVQPLADAGDVAAMRLLGLMYRNGQGVAGVHRLSTRFGGWVSARHLVLTGPAAAAGKADFVKGKFTHELTQLAVLFFRIVAQFKHVS